MLHYFTREIIREQKSPKKNCECYEGVVVQNHEKFVYYTKQCVNINILRNLMKKNERFLQFTKHSYNVQNLLQCTNDLYQI